MTGYVIWDDEQSTVRSQMEPGVASGLSVGDDVL